MAQARGSTSAHLSFETVRFPGRSFMPRSLLSALLRESEGSLVRDRPRGRVCEFGCVFVCVLLGGREAGKSQVVWRGEREETYDC